MNSITKLDECYYKLEILDELLKYGDVTNVIQYIRDDYFTQLIHMVNIAGMYLRNNVSIIPNNKQLAIQYKIDVIEQIFDSGGYNNSINSIYTGLCNFKN